MKSKKAIGTLARNGGEKYQKYQTPLFSNAKKKKKPNNFCGSMLQRNTEESFGKQSDANMYHIGSNFPTVIEVLFHHLFL